jgi:hypothetical protein
VTGWRLHALVFAIAALLDLVWVGATAAVADGRPGEAAAWAACLQVMGAANLLATVRNWRVIPAGILGTVVGTYLTVRFL